MMLRQLLSSSSAGVPSAGHFEPLPSASTSFEHAAALSVPAQHIPQMSDQDKTLAVLDNALPSRYCTQAPTASNHLEESGVHNDLNGTTELFSSTFAMLSADSSLSWDSAWDGQHCFSNAVHSFPVSEMHMAMNGGSFTYPTHSVIACSSGDPRYQSTSNSLLENSGLLSNGQQINAHVNTPNGETVQAAKFTQRANCSEKLSNSALSNFSPAYSRTTHVPQSADRNYLVQMGGLIEGAQMCPPATTVVSNASVIDPVCPYCDRFISHYKGNIRRHINQCMKFPRNAGKFRRKDASLKKVGSGAATEYGGCSSDVFSDSYQPHVLAAGGGSAAWMDATASGSCSTAEMESTKWKLNSTARKDRGNDESFMCPLCDFTTIYKGNMKRHLNTCHGLQDDDLKDGCIDRLKCKEIMETRTEGMSRGRRPKNMQKGIATAAGAIPEVSTNDASSSFHTVRTSSNCKELRTALNSPEAFTIEAAAAAVATSSSASERNELSRSSTIDEAIEAVIANQIESLVNGSQTDHHTA